MNFVRKDNPKLAAIVGTLKSRPPINFNVALKSHALAHGLEVHKIHYTPGNNPKVYVAVKTFNFEHVKTFASNLKNKFPHVIGTTTVSQVALANDGVHASNVNAGAPTKYANPSNKSPYLKL